MSVREQKETQWAVLDYESLLSVMIPNPGPSSGCLSMRLRLYLPPLGDGSMQRMERLLFSMVVMHTTASLRTATLPGFRV